MDAPEPSCIWWGEVNDDGDGPLEWCGPVPADQAEQLAIQVPELVLRTEPARREAVIHLGPMAPRRTGAVAAHHPVAAKLELKSTRCSRASWAQG